MSKNHLPSQLTSFIGRQEELTHLADLIADNDCRLVTVVGPGGIGKTRLALEAARHQEQNFEDGVFDVALAPVVSSDLLVTTIADRLGLTFRGQDTPQVQLCRYLQDKRLLLVLDNFEHLIEASVLLSDLLQAAPELKLLVTSRERLNLQQEWTVVLDGLAYPKDGSAEAHENFSAVRLFIQRARQVHTKFSVREHGDAVVAICRLAEGMPLGLELAASWLRVMSCTQIEAQMASNLDFLTTPLRNIPDRHRSLRAVFDQSWRMLSEEDQAVLMKLSVFRGGFNLESAEYVAEATLSVLASLVDKSLIRVSDDGRYDLHELLRQYAAEKLLNADLTATIIQRHIDYFLQFAEQAEAHLFGREQILWFDRLEIEMDNVRAALARSIESEIGLRFAATLGWFFSERTYWSEGLSWLGQTLQANPDAPDSLRAKALHHIGSLAGHIDDETMVRASCQQAIAIARTTHDDWNLAWALSHLGLYTYFHIDQSIVHLEASVALFRRLGDRMGLAHNLVRLCWKVIVRKDISRALTLIDEAAALIEEVGDTIMSGWEAVTRGRIARESQNLKQSITHFENSIPYFQQAQFPDGVHQSLISVARVELAIGDLDRSFNHFKEAVFLNRVSLRNDVRSNVILAGLASIAKEYGQFSRAVHLLAAAEDEYLIEWSQSDPLFTPYLSDIAAARAQMGEDAFIEAWATGKAMSRQQAIDYALENITSPTIISPASHYVVQSLTERECQILKLMNDGLNSREVAERLFLSVGTIRWYLKIIYNKLDAHSRSEAITRAKELNLLS